MNSLPRIDVVTYRTHLIALALLVTLLGPLALAARGLKVGLELSGGTEIVLRVPPGIDDAAARARLTSPTLDDLAPFEVFRVGASDAHTIAVRARPAPGTADRAAARVAAVLDPQASVLSVSAMGPSVGAAARRDTGIALALSCAGLMAYMALRFEWRPGVAALGALVHDTSVVFGALALTGTEVDIAVIAAVLTALGYSLNDSIVILDRMRENRARHPGATAGELLNQAVNQCLGRTLITNFTVLLSLVAMGLFGPHPLTGFVLTMTVGVISGTLSTFTVVCPLVAAAPRGRPERSERA